MRAAVLPEYGPASALQLRDVPDPVPGVGDVLVKMAGAGMNPIDWKQRSGAARAIFPLKFPAILGRDVSGTVAAVGVGVTALKAGDRVLGSVPGAAYAELVVGPIARRFPLAEAAAAHEVAERGVNGKVLLLG